MLLKQRKSIFVQLGEVLKTLGERPENRAENAITERFDLKEIDAIIQIEVRHNGWFTEENVRKAMASLGASISEESLEEWLGRYALSEKPTGNSVGLILAGNIPLVGFHDVMSVVLSGNKAKVKLSRDDARLLPAVFGLAVQMDSGFKELIEFVLGKLEGYDAIIATGSNNTSRYFDHYFGKGPNIIRKNRTSVAVLTGEETEEELELLGADIFTYFGLGCRNVTKVMMPTDFDINRLFAGLFPYKDIVNHNKYANNYDYHKALWLLNQDALIENGFILVKEDEALVSPVGSLYVQRYASNAELEAYLTKHESGIQVVVGKNYFPFGEAQKPKLWDYADGVDTVSFLTSLS
ncbi:MAG: hypothetical protein ACI80P_000839 [Flavobacteriales bacterium]|jgi:hypothetical protein